VRTKVAVVGDIHGNVNALAGLLREIQGRYVKIVFVGDYINRGHESSGVLEILVRLSQSFHGSVFLAGNHELALLKYIDGRDPVRFLAMGGAATINSYVKVGVERDVANQFRTMIPSHHVEFLRMLRPHHSESGLLVTHCPQLPSGLSLGESFHVYGHVPQPNLLPNVSKSSAAIDTGCGTLSNGRLTCLFWPSLEVVQVDPSGKRVADLS